MARRKREVGRFRVRADDGREFEVIEYAAMIDVRTLDDPNAPDLEGLHELVS